MESRDSSEPVEEEETMQPETTLDGSPVKMEAWEQVLSTVRNPSLSPFLFDDSAKEPLYESPKQIRQELHAPLPTRGHGIEDWSRRIPTGRGEFGGPSRRLGVDPLLQELHRDPHRPFPTFS